MLTGQDIWDALLEREVKICPNCKEHGNVVPIMYGLPTEAGFAASRRGDIVLGGCVCPRFGPWLFCRRCRTSFDCGPIRRAKLAPLLKAVDRPRFG